MEVMIIIMTITHKEKLLFYREEHVPTLKVFCDGCKDFHSSDEIITSELGLGIEEDFMGRDVITFKCKTDEKIHKGIVISS
jgi:hypothetical protein